MRGESKFLYFNTGEYRESDPKGGGGGEGGYTTKQERQAAKEAMYANTTVKHRVVADFAGSQAVFKVKGTSGILVDDQVSMVNAEGVAIVGFIAGSETQLVASISSIDADGNYSVTMDSNVTGVYDLSEDGEVWVEFTTPTDPKDPTPRGAEMCYPIERFKGFLTEAESRETQSTWNGEKRTGGRDGIMLVFEPLIGAPESTVTDNPTEHWDYVWLVINPGKQKDVISTICRYINGNRNKNDGFISVYDNIMKDSVSNDIIGCIAQLAVS